MIVAIQRACDRCTERAQHHQRGMCQCACHRATHGQVRIPCDTPRTCSLPHEILMTGPTLAEFHQIAAEGRDS